MTPELERTRNRVAAGAAFGGFWAALAVTIGVPLLVVACAYVIGVAVLVAVALRPHASVLAPRAADLGRAAARSGQAGAARVRGVDWTPVNARAAHVSRWIRAGGAAGLQVTSAGATRAAAAGAVARRRLARNRDELRARFAAGRSRHAAHAEAFALNTRAATLRQEGRLVEALDAGERALALVREVGDRRAEALTLNGLGLTQARLGDESAAIDSYEAAAAILTRLGDQHGAGRVLANLGSLHLDLGHRDEARSQWRHALERLEPGSREHERTAEQLRSAV